MGMNISKPTFQGMANNIFANYRDKTGKKSIDKVNFDEFRNLFDCDLPLFINLDKFDKNNDKYINCSEMAKILETSDKEGLDPSLPLCKEEWNNGVISCHELYSVLDNSVDVLKNPVRKTDIPQELKTKALDRIANGNYSVYSPQNIGANNLTKQKLTKFDLHFHSQNTAKLYIKNVETAEKNGIDRAQFDKLFFTVLAEKGEVGVLIPSEKDDGIFTYETQRANKVQESYEAERIVRSFSKKDFNKGNLLPSAHLKFKDNRIDAPKELQQQINLDDSELAIQTREKLQGLLSSEELDKLYENVDFSNSEKFKESFEPIIRKMLKTGGLKKQAGIYIVDDPAGVYAAWDNDKGVLINRGKLSSDIKLYKRLGLTEKQARVYTINKTLGALAHEIMGHGLIDSWNTNKPENLDEKDSKLVQYLQNSQNSGERLNIPCSYELVGSTRLYSGQPQEAFAFMLGQDFYSRYLNEQAFR